MALQTYGITPTRMKIVDYLTTTNGVTGKIYIKNPTETFDWMVYLNPLRMEAWIGIVTFCILIPVLMSIVLYFRKLMCEYHRELP